MLVGPKGSGKTFIGELMQKHFGITFLPEENWTKGTKKDSSLSHTSYLTEVFAKMEQKVRKALEEHDTVVLEATPLTKAFEIMFETLRTEFYMTTIGVWATHVRCMERIRAKSQGQDIQASEEEIRAINSMVVDRAAQTNFKIENNDATVEELIGDLKTIISA